MCKVKICLFNEAGVYILSFSTFLIRSVLDCWWLLFEYCAISIQDIFVHGSIYVDIEMEYCLELKFGKSASFDSCQTIYHQECCDLLFEKIELYSI